MPRLGGQARLHSSLVEDARPSANAAGDRIDAACRLAVAGKLALRDIATWTRGFRVSETEFRLLWLLFQHEHRGSAPQPVLDQGELAAGLAISPAQVSGLVERLQASALIDRVASGFDRRRQLWRLAAAGETLVLDVVANVERGADLERSAIPPLAPPFEGGGSEAA
jgi:DNA-binding MarR family transcriptional regulator